MLAPRAAAAAQLPSAETARRRRPKLTRSSRQRPPQSRTRVPWQCPLPLPSPGRGQIEEFEIWKGRRARMPETEGWSHGSSPPLPIPHPSRPLVRSPPARCSRLRLPSRGHRSAPPRGGGPRDKLGYRQSPQDVRVPIVLAVPFGSPGDRRGSPRGWLRPPRRR